MVVVVVLQFGRRSIGFTLRSATRERRSGTHAPERTMADYHRQRRIKLIVTCTINWKPQAWLCGRLWYACSCTDAPVRAGVVRRVIFGGGGRGIRALMQAATNRS